MVAKSLPAHHHRGWRVVSAEFETSAPSLAKCPVADVPEVAIVGRSNVGKSSLINALTGRRGLARVGSTPGRTRLLNFYRVKLRSPEGEVSLRLVDLPGWGHAAAAKHVRAGFAPMIEGYLDRRDALLGLVLLVDARREVDERDRELFAFARGHGLAVLLVVTKVDKLGKAQRGTLASRIAAAFGARADDVLLTSATERVGLGDEPGSGGLARELAVLASEHGTSGS